MTRAPGTTRRSAALEGHRRREIVADHVGHRRRAAACPRRSPRSPRGRTGPPHRRQPLPELVVPAHRRRPAVTRAVPLRRYREDTRLVAAPPARRAGVARADLHIGIDVDDLGTGAPARRRAQRGELAGPAWSPPSPGSPKTGGDLLRCRRCTRWATTTICNSPGRASASSPRSNRPITARLVMCRDHHADHAGRVSSRRPTAPPTVESRPVRAGRPSGCTSEGRTIRSDECVHNWPVASGHGERVADSVPEPSDRATCRDGHRSPKGTAIRVHLGPRPAGGRPADPPPVGRRVATHRAAAGRGQPAHRCLVRDGHRGAAALPDRSASGWASLAYGFIDGLYQGVSALVRIAGGYAGDRHEPPKWIAAIGYGVSALSRIALLPAQASPPSPRSSPPTGSARACGPRPGTR